MKTRKMLAAAGWVALTTCAWANAAPAPAVAAAPASAAATLQLTAVRDLLASMQAEKMMRVTAGTSRYANEQQRKAVMAKLDKVAPQEIYRRLAVPLARLITQETATEMTRFYGSAFGKRVLHSAYNSAGEYRASEPRPSASEKSALQRPAFLKAHKAYKAAEPAIMHAAFVLVKEIANK